MKIHIISIAGTMTAALAQALIKQGHIVTGSDQQTIFPPISTLIKKNKIPFNTTVIDNNIDLVIVGSSYYKFSNTKEEFELAKSKNIPYISATEYIGKYLCKENSVLIAGSYGKTTISAMIAWVLKSAKMNPSIMIGGQLIKKFDSVRITSSKWSVVEADESIHGLDTKAKFLYYPVRYLILTSANWEHKDSYKTEEENINAYKQLVKNIPNDGILVFNENDKIAKEISKECIGKIVSYNGSNSTYKIDKINKKESTFLNINNQEIKTNLIGQFNYENILATFALLKEIGISEDNIKKHILTFPGVKRRLEKIYDKNEIIIFDDFAQSSPRISSCINSIKDYFPKHKICVYFEPHAGFLQNINGLDDFDKAFINADRVILGKIKFTNKDKLNRITANDYKKMIGEKMVYLPLEHDIIKNIKSYTNQKVVIINMSSGGLQNHQIIQKIINSI